MNRTTRGAVIVAVDDLNPTGAAVEWAALDAGRRRKRFVILSSSRLSLLQLRHLPLVPPVTVDPTESMDRASAHAVGTAGNVDLQKRAVHQSLPVALSDAAQDADTIVLSNRRVLRGMVMSSGVTAVARVGLVPSLWFTNVHVGGLRTHG